MASQQITYAWLKASTSSFREQDQATGGYNSLFAAVRVSESRPQIVFDTLSSNPARTLRSINKKSDMEVVEEFQLNRLEIRKFHLFVNRIPMDSGRVGALLAEGR